MLLLHGDRDPQANVDQSEAMAKELKRAGKDYKYVRFKDGDHQFSAPRDREQLLREIEAFLGRHLQPSAAPAP